MERISNNLSNSRTRIAERLTEISSKFGYDEQHKVNLEKIYRNTDAAIIPEGVTNPANVPVLKNVSVDLISATVPNLVAPELYAVQPIDSPDALVGYWSFEYGDDKGEALRGQTFNSSLGLGNTKPYYSSSLVKDEAIKVAMAPSESAKSTDKLSFTSVIPGSVKLTTGGATHTDDGKGGFTGLTDVTINYVTGVITNASTTVAVEGKITYNYDNVNEPTKIPTLFAGRKNLRMQAKQYALSTPISITAAEIARRSLSTDLRAELTAQGAGELAFEIDCLLLNDIIDSATAYTPLTWSAVAPLGVTRKERFSDFELALNQGAAVMGKATGRFYPTHILTDPMGLWVIKSIPGFKEKAATNKTGAYVAGELDNGMKVVVSTRTHLEPGQVLLIHRGAEKLDAPGVYSPYIPITSTDWIPSQELGEKKTYYTWYASKITNNSLIFPIQIQNLGAMM